MRLIAYKILTFTLAATVFVVTTGVSIFKHDCACKNTVTTSVFIAHTCHSTTESNASGSCSTGSCTLPKHNVDIPQNTSNCGCKTVQVNLKLDERFTIPMQISTPQIKLFSAIITTLFNSSSIEISAPTTHKWSFAESPPPLSFGKGLVYALHQIKIPTPFCS
ncbi:MAG: hypothetical protein JW783_07460 [Bacteroidales bacterium]|nr:hypothetical protein [Bacteroidales bacterium]MBN2748739.1 hypothetical protein [Bacteroidales bacterium]